jgi:hypothetical protein
LFCRGKRAKNPPRGFKTLPTVSATIKGFEVMRMIRKGHCRMREPGVAESEPQGWPPQHKSVPPFLCRRRLFVDFVNCCAREMAYQASEVIKFSFMLYRRRASVAATTEIAQSTTLRKNNISKPQPFERRLSAKTGTPKLCCFTAVPADNYTAPSFNSSAAENHFGMCKTE